MSRITRAVDPKVIDAPGSFTPSERLARQWRLLDFEIKEEFRDVRRSNQRAFWRARMECAETIARIPREVTQ